MVRRDRPPAWCMPAVHREGGPSTPSAVAFRLLTVIAMLVVLLQPQLVAADSLNLTGLLPAGWDLWGYATTSDGAYLVYCVDPTANGALDDWDLYSVPSTGGTPVKLTGTLASASWPTWAISPDGSRVVYAARLVGDSGIQLYSVPIDGPAEAAVRLNPPLAWAGGVSELYITPDSGTVVYVSDQDTRYENELYSVPIAGGASTKLNGPLVEGGRLWSSAVEISPDGSRVLYRASQDTKGVTELYCVPTHGGTPVKLNPELVAGGDVRGEAAFSPDGRWVVYRADQDVDEAVDLYRVPVSGGASSRLSAAMAADRGIDTFAISPDSSRVIYYADQDTDDLYEIYSVPLLGGSVVKLNRPLPAGGGIWRSLNITADSAYLVYQASQDTADVVEIYSVPLAGGTVVKLNAPMVSGGDVNNLNLSPDGSTVVYLADQETDGVDELYSVAVTGGTATKLNGALVGGGDVEPYSWDISPDGTRVVYIADQEADERWELYSVPTAGGVPLKLSGVLVSGGDVSSCAAHPDSSMTLFAADKDTNDRLAIYLADDGRISASFASATATVGEGDGSIDLAVELRAPADQQMSVSYAATRGTATGGGVDYTLASDTLTFAVGESSKVITVSIVDDELPEVSETVIVRLSAPVNAAIGAKSRVTITIEDNELAFHLPLVSGHLGPQ